MSAALRPERVLRSFYAAFDLERKSYQVFKTRFGCRSSPHVSPQNQRVVRAESANSFAKMPSVGRNVTLRPSLQPTQSPSMLNWLLVPPGIFAVKVAFEKYRCNSYPLSRAIFSTRIHNLPRIHNLAEMFASAKL
jgi:hypothetical protein